MRNFNAKIARIKQKDPSAGEYLPERVSLRDVRKQIDTRADFKKELHALERFTRRGAEQPIENQYGLKTTKWEKREMSIQLSTINRERARLREIYERTPVSADGMPTGKSRADLPADESAEMYQPKKFDFEKQRPGDAFEHQRESLFKQSRAGYMDERRELFKENYIKALDKVYGTRAGGLINKIKEMSAQDVVNKLHEEVDADIFYHYATKDQDQKLETLGQIWGEFEEEEYSL